MTVFTNVTASVRAYVITADCSIVITIASGTVSATVIITVITTVITTVCDTF